MYGLSNILLVDMLILAERSYKKGVLQWQNAEFLQIFAHALVEGFVQVIATYTGQNEEKSLKFALEGGTDWIQMAKEISFWVDNSPTGYMPWIEKNEIPSNLYKKEIEIDVTEMSEAQNYSRLIGLNSNGNQDIGLYNGVLGLVEFEKAIYLLFNAIIIADI